MSAEETKQKYGTILTDAGKAAIANAAATNTLIDIGYIALGDGGGVEYCPEESQTELKNQVHQIPVNNVFIDPDNPNWIVVEGLIPESAGGFTIREAAIKTEDGNVIAIGSYPSSYKPKLEEGSAIAIGFKFILEVTNASIVNMNIDPSTIYATIQYVNNRVSNHADATDAHGGTYLKTPLRLMYRNADGRCQVADPTDPADATPMGWVEKAIAKSGGILPWSNTTTYNPLPWLVWGSDNMLYVALQPSGPGVAAGPKDPTTTTGYWQTLAEYVISDIGGGGGNPFANDLVYPGAIGTFFLSSPPANWRVRNGQLITSASTVCPQLYAALQTSKFASLLASEATWQSMSVAAGGIGGVPRFVLNTGANTIRLPDTRGDYMEHAGFDGLAVGGYHSDMIRNITGTMTNASFQSALPAYPGPTGAFKRSGSNVIDEPYEEGPYGATTISLDLSLVVPIGNANKPRAFGVLGCVYVGPPTA